MSGGTISDNIVDSARGGALGGGVYNAGQFYFKGGEIRKNILKYSGGGAGGGVYHDQGIFVISGGAVITPNLADSLTLSASGEYIDPRNSVIADSIGVYGMLTGNNNGIAALLDIDPGRIGYNIIKAADAADASSGIPPVLYDYNGNAPTDRFALGYFLDYIGGITDIVTGAPVVDPSAPNTTPAQWDTAGDGTLMNKP
jgi:hypothetical protein